MERENFKEYLKLCNYDRTHDDRPCKFDSGFECLNHGALQIKIFCIERCEQLDRPDSQTMELYR